MEQTNGKRRLWQDYEFIAVLNLYMQMPFAKMYARNPKVVELANLLGRTPNSIALRLVNFASCDPMLAAKGIKGMQGGKEQCKPYWEKFENDREALAFEGAKIISELQGKTVEQTIPDMPDLTGLQGESRKREVQTRVNQNLFRRMILAIYDNRCALTGMEQPQLLIASHIIPWSDQTHKNERLNPQNGICLNALHDKAFDKGLMTFDDDYRAVLSKELRDHCTKDYYHQYFAPIDGKALTIPNIDYAPDKNFLEWHRKQIFEG